MWSWSGWCFGHNYWQFWVLKRMYRWLETYNDYVCLYFMDYRFQYHLVLGMIIANFHDNVTNWLNPKIPLNYWREKSNVLQFSKPNQNLNRNFQLSSTHYHWRNIWIIAFASVSILKAGRSSYFSCLIICPKAIMFAALPPLCCSTARTRRSFHAS